MRLKIYNLIIILLLSFLIGQVISIAYHIKSLDCQDYSVLKDHIIEQQELINELNWEIEQMDALFGDKLYDQ